MSRYGYGLTGYEPRPDAPTRRALFDLRRQVTGVWIDVVFQNAWVNYGVGYQTAQYRKVGDRVELRGLIAGGSNAAAFTLPVEYRPPAILFFPALATGPAAATLTIGTDGTCVPSADAPTYFTLDGISFSVEL